MNYGPYFAPGADVDVADAQGDWTGRILNIPDSADDFGIVWARVAVLDPRGNPWRCTGQAVIYAIGQLRPVKL